MNKIYKNISALFLAVLILSSSYSACFAFDNKSDKTTSIDTENKVEDKGIKSEDSKDETTIIHEKDSGFSELKDRNKKLSRDYSTETHSLKYRNIKFARKLKDDRLKPGEKLIAITFDDGPSDYTERLLDALKEKDIRVTFFILGNKVRGRENILRREFNEGHDIGTHTYSHPDLRTLSEYDIKTELLKCNNIIRNILGFYPTIVRPPFGAYDNRVKAICKELNQTMVLWNLTTMDWFYNDKNVIEKRILNFAKDGDIVLLHDSHEPSVEAFIDCIDELKQKGFKFVTISQLMKAKNKTLNPGDIYYSVK